MTFTETLNGAIWTASDEWASENETGDFLYGLTRLLKPRIVLETGCYTGQTSKRIGEALLENSFGKLLSCDTNRDMVKKAALNCIKVSNPLPCYFFHQTGEELCRSAANVDLAFLDSSGNRVEEAKALLLSSRGIAILHDARRDDLRQIVEDLHWQYIFADIPRGLAILQPQKNL